MMLQEMKKFSFQDKLDLHAHETDSIVGDETNEERSLETYRPKGYTQASAEYGQ